MNAESFDGLLVLDKPAGITSRAAVDRALRWFPRRTRMGHTGTLDPLATGVLVLCLGSATRLAEYVQRMGKTYVSTLRLGARSDSDDADGSVTPVAGAVAPSGAAVLAGLAGLVGTIEQVPPRFSAVKVTGQRAYDLARQGQEMTLQPRTVEVYDLAVRRYDYPELEVEVRCGKGTYVRSLARDLGENLGCGAYVQALRRTRVGPFSAAGALALEATAEEARARLLPPGLAVGELPDVTFGPREWDCFRRGQAVTYPGGVPARVGGGEVAVFDGAGRLLAVAAVDARYGLLRPARVIA